MKLKGAAKALPSNDSPLPFLSILELALGTELACVPGRTAGDISLFMGFLGDKRSCWHWPLGFFSWERSVVGQALGLELAVWVLI